MKFFWLLELILSAAGSESAFGMRIRIQETNLMRIHADPDPKHYIYSMSPLPRLFKFFDWTRV
jgi:hypothetical protein